MARPRAAEPYLRVNLALPWSVYRRLDREKKVHEVPRTTLVATVLRKWFSELDAARLDEKMKEAEKESGESPECTSLEVENNEK